MNSNDDFTHIYTDDDTTNNNDILRKKTYCNITDMDGPESLIIYVQTF